MKWALCLALLGASAAVVFGSLAAATQCAPGWAPFAFGGLGTATALLLACFAARALA